MNFEINDISSLINNFWGEAWLKVEVKVYQGLPIRFDRLYQIEVQPDFTIRDIWRQIVAADNLDASQLKLKVDKNTRLFLEFNQPEVTSVAVETTTEERNSTHRDSPLFPAPTLNKSGLGKLASSVRSLHARPSSATNAFVTNIEGLPRIIVAGSLIDQLNYVLWRSVLPLKVKIVSVYDTAKNTLSLLDMYLLLESGNQASHNSVAEAYRCGEVVRLRNVAKLKCEWMLTQNPALTSVGFNAVVAHETSAHTLQLAGDFGDFDLYFKYNQSGLKLGIARYGDLVSSAHVPYTEVAYTFDESRYWDWDIRELEFLFREHVQNWRARSETTPVVAAYLDYSRRSGTSLQAVASKQWARGITHAAKGINYSWKGTEERMSVKSLVGSAGVAPRLADFKLPSFEITRKALDKIRYLCWRNLKVIGWYLIYRVSSNTGAIKVVDICVPPQNVTAVTFKVDSSSMSSLNRQSYIQNPDCQIAYWLIAHSNVNFPTDPSGLDLDMFWQYMDDHQNWTFIVNRQGDLRLMFGDAAVSRNHFVEYVPWTIDEEIRWDWDVTALEKVMKESVENWEAASGTEVVVQEALRLAANENRNSAAPVTSITLEPEISNTVIQPAVIQEAAVSETAATSEPKLTNAQILERIAVHKVTFDPAFQRTKNEKGYFIPDDPNFIVIEGYGKVTREEMLSDWVVLSREQKTERALPKGNLLMAPNGFILSLALLPNKWIPRLLRK
jgi:hypothetical protein